MGFNMKAGFWKLDITPPLDAPLVGSWTDLSVTDYLQPLHCNAIVLDDGKSKIAIASVEVCSVREGICHEIRLEVEKRCGISYANTIINATHVHAGPKVTGDPADSYSQNLKMQIVTAIWMADKCMSTVRLGVGKTKNEGFTHNRRLTDPNGEIAMNWFDPKSLQDCVENMTDRDTDVLAIRFEDEDGNVKGFIINYSNHNNARGGTEINADFGAYIGEKLAAIYGKDVVTVLLLGFCGNVNWIDYRDLSWVENPWHWRRVGDSLLSNILDISSRLYYPNDLKLTANYITYQEKERDFNDYDSKIDRTFDYQPQGGLEVEQEALRGQPLRMLDIHISMLAIGDDIAIVTCNAEVFSEYALRIKDKSPYMFTIMVELANGGINYICTPGSYKKGGYEVRKPATLVEYEAGERMLAAMLEMIKNK